MGARQRAQKRGKAPKGSQKGTPTLQRKLNSSLHVPDLTPTTRSNALLGWQDLSLSSSPSDRDRRQLTMGDAARNTERHTSGWGSSKLRAQAISFVSAGTLHQEPEHVRAQKEENTPEEDRQEEIPRTEPSQPVQTPKPVEIEASRQPEINVVPVIQYSPVEEATQQMSATSLRPRSSSASSSSSSEADRIVFTGRSKGPTPNPTSQNVSKRQSRAQSPVKSTLVEEQTPADPVPAMQPAKPISIVQEPISSQGFEASSSDRRIVNSRLRKRGGRNRRRQSDEDEQEALMRDYIANMAMDDTEESEEPIKSLPSQPQSTWSKPRKNETFRYYDGAGEENMKVQIQSTQRQRPHGAIEQALDWDSDDLRDFDDLDTTDDEVEDISQVLRQRERKSGKQYLVTPIGLETSDAKWVLHEKLVSESASKEIAIFEEIVAMEFGESYEDDDDDDEDEDETTDSEVEEALNDLIDHIESEDDENARIMKHTARMTDEQIARALAKQEELGMGGDELMLFSGDIEDEEEEEDMNLQDAFGRNDDFISFSLKQHTSNRTRSKRNKKQRDTFPSAAAFADALDEDPYGAFDVMDFDRPSLRPRKKGRKSDLYDLQLEDDELRDQLISAWTNDREKKAQRKRDKEEARMAALLEYADRSDPAAIKAEIRRFLVQDIDTLRLSPMESSTRAAVHRLAKALKLNSRSEGKDGTDKGRYPVLTKTIRTPSYTIDTVWEVDALLNTKKFFPKNTTSYKKDKLPRGTARTMRMRQSGGVSGASYMNGEIVGASAPEIGADNKGRAMLEKMGWTSGMAIGAEGNKGSLDVVRHVFKTSRAGLG